MEKKVFRFNLCDDIMSIITQFAKTHQHDDRHTYKSAWQVLLNREDELFQREVRRLEQLGYKGDALDKIFKAGRYYFREKALVPSEVAVPAVPSELVPSELVPAAAPAAPVPAAALAEPAALKKRREYIVMSTGLITAMDAHLKSIQACKPSDGYTQFCETHMDILRSEITRLITTLSKEKIAEKLKKTYKNRYYMMLK